MSRHTVPLSRFHDERRATRLVSQPMELLQPIQAELLAVAHSVSEKDEEVSPSLLSSLGGKHAEAGVYLRSGARRGAVIHLRWSDRTPDQVHITVRPLSHLQVVLVWTALGVSLALGLGVAAVLPVESAELGLILGLLLGVALGVALIFGITNSGLGSSAESKAMAARLERAVEAWHAERAE